MTFTADAVEHSEVVQAGNVLQFVTPKDFMLAMRVEDLSKAVQRVSARQFKITVTVGDGAPAISATVGEQKQDEVAQRAGESGSATLPRSFRRRSAHRPRSKRVE
jgi:hypothetical protein